MKVGKKVLIACISVLLFIAVEYVLFYIFHYYLFDDYKETLTSYTAEAGSEYKPLADTSSNVEGMDLVAESDRLKLYADTKTGYVAVYDKKLDQTFYTNPPDAEEDPLAKGENQDLLKAQMIVNYFNADRVAGDYNTYTECVAVSPDQLSVESIANGIRFTYYISPKKQYAEMVPYGMNQERYEAFCSKMSSSNQKIMDQYYKLNEETGEYEVLENMKNGEGNSRAYYAIYQALYEEAQYTEEDYALDMTEAGETSFGHIAFRVPLEYRLDGEDLVVSIPTSLIEEEVGQINSIELLDYFGAAGPDEEGYILVPNGSGSLINFNNGKASTADYSSYVYGLDPLAADYTKVENAEVSRLPIYAICRKDNSLVAHIEDGASLAQVRTRIAGRINSCNAAHFVFSLRGNERLAMFGTTGNAADIPVVEKNLYDVNLQVRYAFLGEDQTGYTGVANYYRQYLMDKGVLTALGDPSSRDVSDINFYYDVLGAAKITEYFLGAQYLAVKPVTTFNQARTIAESLNSAGITKQIVNYQGWFNGGYYHDVTDRLKIVGKLGKESDFENLASYVEGIGGKVYGDVAFQKVTYISKRYSNLNESARYYTGYSVSLGLVNPVTLRQTSGLGYEENLYSLVSPKFLVRYVDKFLSKSEKIDITGISLRDLGDVLASDKKRTEFINREQAMDVVVAQLQKIADSGKDVLVSGGNDYAVGFADDLINVPTGHNSYYAVDEEVPFYEMVIHGSVPYGGSVINLSDNYDVDDIALRLIEYGAAPHFAFSYEESNALKYTGLNVFYSTTFDTWKDTAVQIYQKVNDALKYVTNATIVNHEILQSGVRRVTYSNGVVITVNTTEESVTVDGTEIAAKSYVMGGVN